MIEQFDVTQREIEFCIIPELKPYLDYSLSKGDTVVCFVDMDKYSPEDTQHFYKMLTSTFPNNQVLILPKGTEIGVIKDGAKCY